MTLNPRKNISFVDHIFCYIKNILNFYHTFLGYRRTFHNYTSVIKKKRINDFPIKTKLRNGTEVQIHNLFQLHMYVYNVQKFCSFNDGMLIMKLSNSKEIKFFDWEWNGDLFPIFFDDDYSFLPVKNSVIIDIGANIADSSIFFALNGAKQVVALEPSPRNFESAVKNVKINGLNDVIEVINAGCSGKTGTMVIEKEKDGIYYSLEEKKDGITIPIFSLTQILKKTSSSSCILKIDCEGCEYDSILETSKENLRRFSHIQIEYHYGYRNLKDKLENCGFKVKITKPQFGRRLSKKFRKTYLGFIFAERKDV